jgi:hypothetical protein
MNASLCGQLPRIDRESRAQTACAMPLAPAIGWLGRRTMKPNVSWRVFP